jgi:hypothetical protein
MEVWRASILRSKGSLPIKDDNAHENYECCAAFLPDIAI